MGFNLRGERGQLPRPQYLSTSTVPEPSSYIRSKSFKLRPALDQMCCALYISFCPRRLALRSAEQCETGGSLGMLSCALSIESGWSSTRWVLFFFF